MAGLRTYLNDFALQNEIYALAIVRVYTVDPTTQEPTTTLATLYSDVVGGHTLINPQQLDGHGRWVQPVYVDQAVVLDITTSELETHQTGITGVTSSYRGDWAASTVFLFGDTVRDGAAGANTRNIYICTQNHTSSGWAADLAAGIWSLYIDIDTGVDYLPLAGGTVTGSITVGDGLGTALTVLGAAAITGGFDVTGQSTFESRIIVTESGFTPTLVSGGMGFFNAGQGVATRLVVDSYGIGAGAGYITRRANGTESVPTGLLTGDAIGGFQGRGYGTSGFGVTRAEVRYVATENWTDAAQGTRIEFHSTNTGTTTTSSRMALHPPGRLRISAVDANSDDGVNVLQVVGDATVSGVYKVDGTQVVKERITGWSVATGTATRTTFATGSVTLAQLAERVKALIDDLHGTAGHGLIGT